MTTQDTMRLALEALMYHTQQTRPISKTDEAIEALKSALAQQEPTPLWPDDDPKVVAMAERVKELEAALAQQGEQPNDYEYGFRRGLEASASYKAEALAYKEAYFKLVEQVASLKALEPAPPIILQAVPAAQPIIQNQITKDNSFQPDWASYEQGFSDGKAEALAQQGEQQPVAWADDKAIRGDVGNVCSDAAKRYWEQSDFVDRERAQRLKHPLYAGAAPLSHPKTENTPAPEGKAITLEPAPAAQPIIQNYLEKDKTQRDCSTCKNFDEGSYGEACITCAMYYADHWEAKE